MLSSGRPIARVHAKFLRKYTPPEANLEGGNVVNPELNALKIGSPWLIDFDTNSELL